MHTFIGIEAERYFAQKLQWTGKLMEWVIVDTKQDVGIFPYHCLQFGENTFELVY